MPKAKVTSKGQITIPKKIREQLDIHAGDEVLFEQTEQGEVKLSSPKKSIKDLRGILYRQNQKAKTIQEMNDGIAEYLKEKHRV